MKQKGNKKGFTGCAQAYIRKLQEEGRFSTAHVYKNAVLSFTKFCTTPNIAFGQITRDNLRRYGQYLYEHGLKPNTVSTYMRMLRSIYNRGVEAGIARFIPRLFRDVYTGVDVRQKKALPAGELHTLLYKPPHSEHLKQTQAHRTADVSILRHAIRRLRTFREIGIRTWDPQVQPHKNGYAHEPRNSGCIKARNE